MRRLRRDTARVDGHPSRPWVSVCAHQHRHAFVFPHLAETSSVGYDGLIPCVMAQPVTVLSSRGEVAPVTRDRLIWVTKSEESIVTGPCQSTLGTVRLALPTGLKAPHGNGGARRCNDCGHPPPSYVASLCIC